MAKHGFRVIERWEEWGDRELFEQDAKPSELFRRQRSFLALPHLSSETKRKVLWDNCARLYNLQPVSVESPGGN